MNEAETIPPARIVNAVGPETYTFRELWQELARSMGIWRPIVPVPAWLGAMAAGVLGRIEGDVMLTRDEIEGLSQGRLAVPDPTVGIRSLSHWLRGNAATLGREYASELARRK